MVQRIGGDPVAVQGNEHGFFVAGVVLLADIAGEPAFDPAPLVVVGAGAFVCKIFPGLETIDIEVTDIGTDLLETFDKFFEIGHVAVPLIFCCSLWGGENWTKTDVGLACKNVFVWFSTSGVSPMSN